MSVVRREILSYVYEHGPIEVDQGAARSVVRDNVVRILEDEFNMGSPNGVSVEMAGLASRKLLLDGPRDGGRSPRHRLSISELGERELARLLDEYNMHVPPGLRHHLEPDDDDDGEVDFSDDLIPSADVAMELPAVELVDAFTPTVETDAEAVAAALLRRVLRLGRSGDVDDLDEALAAARRENDQLRQTVDGMTSEAERLRSENHSMKAALNDARRAHDELTQERDDALRALGRANRLVGELRDGRSDGPRSTYQIWEAMSEEDRRELDRLMRSNRAPDVRP